MTADFWACVCSPHTPPSLPLGHETSLQVSFTYLTPPHFSGLGVDLPFLRKPSLHPSHSQLRVRPAPPLSSDRRTLLNSFTGFLPAGSIAPWCLSHYSLRVFLKPWTLPMAGEVTALTKGIHPSVFTPLPFIPLERVSINHTKETRNDPRPDVLVSPQSISNLGPCPWRPGSRCKPCGGRAQATVQLCAQSI